MSGFNDVIEDALPFNARERIDATQGTTWTWSYDVADDANALVDMTSGYTATMVITSKTGSVVCTPTVTFPSVGRVTCFAGPTTTAAVSPGTYYHELTITRTSDGAKVVVVGSGVSTFTVKRKVS